LLGWATAPFEAYDADYRIIESSVGVGGAIVPGDVASGRGGAVVFAEVQDLQDCVGRAIEFGAAVEQAPTPITDTAGTFATVRDPQGTRLGLRQGRAHWSAEIRRPAFSRSSSFSRLASSAFIPPNWFRHR
jgi:predicted enzyme related to lactoylglutathione lyase